MPEVYSSSAVAARYSVSDRLCLPPAASERVKLG